MTSADSLPTPKPRGPVFVCGCPRSGTSGLGWAIAATPEYWTSVETHFFFNLLAENGRNKIFDAFELSKQAGSWVDKHGVYYEEFLSYIGSGLNALMLSRSDQVQWVDNSPENLLAADDLLMMFTDAVIIHVVRDPREVCASMLLSGFEREPWSNDVDDAIDTWKHYASTGQALKSRHPDRVLEIMHTKMVHEPGDVAATLGSFLELPDGKPIEDFLRSERVNSSYDAASRLADEAGKSHSATLDQRQHFLQEYADYILDRAQPYAAAYGFGEHYSLAKG